VSQLGRTPHPFWRRRETRDIHPVAAPSTEDQRLLAIHEPARDGLLSHAMADAYDAMRKTACQAFGKDQEFAPQTSGSFKTQSVKRVKAARNASQPCRKAAKKPGLGCAHIGNRGTQRPQNTPHMPGGSNVPHGRNFPFHGNFQHPDAVRSSHFPLARTFFRAEQRHVKARVLEIFRLTLQESKGNGRVHCNDQPWPI